MRQFGGIALHTLNHRRRARRKHYVWMVLGLAAATFARPALVAAASPTLPPALPSDEQAVARLLAIAGEGFKIHETDHFTIAYDTPYEVLHPLIDRLEGTYDTIRRFCEVSGLNVEPPALRLEVILFDRYEDFARYAAGVGMPVESIAGFYHQEVNIAAFCNTLCSPDLQRITRQIEKIQKQLAQLKKEGSGASVAAAAAGLATHPFHTQDAAQRPRQAVQPLRHPA